MKDAMTDHKAEWVERMIGACVPGGSYCDPQRVADAIREYYAVRAAAPAASEGEDGAVKWQRRYKHPWPDGTFADWYDISREQYDDALAKDLRGAYSYRALYTRPAAQVAATPKHDEGREAVEAALLDMADAAAKADSSNCTPSQSREHWARYDAAEKIVRRALATQPAARRVTDADVFKACADYTIALGKCGSRLGSKSPHEIAMRAALESFAQPAEGVSGG